MIERGVMMELKMFSKPVVFTDFDGVLNAFPDDKLLRRGGVNKVMTWAKPDSPYAKMYNPEKSVPLGRQRKSPHARRLMAHPLVQRTVRRHVRVGS